jgi:hypothetical protein
MDLRSKARKQRIAIKRAQLQELERAFPYIGYPTYYWNRKRQLESELAQIKNEVYREERIDLSTDDKIEQYLIIVE